MYTLYHANFFSVRINQVQKLKKRFDQRTFAAQAIAVNKEVGWTVNILQEKIARELLKIRLKMLKV